MKKVFAIIITVLSFSAEAMLSPEEFSTSAAFSKFKRHQSSRSYRFFCSHYSVNYEEPIAFCQIYQDLENVKTVMRESGTAIPLPPVNVESSHNSLLSYLDANWNVFEKYFEEVLSLQKMMYGPCCYDFSCYVPCYYAPSRYEPFGEDY
ncbi:MAG: hypothetical protein LBO73_00790 [Holosporaceae bacterium]|jgi:hypothetical protein|nr:hypothetical protein [Holosporaceae bacterium]